MRPSDAPAARQSFVRLSVLGVSEEEDYRTSVPDLVSWAHSVTHMTLREFDAERLAILVSGVRNRFTSSRVGISSRPSIPPSVSCKHG
jgi:hypothetical protein